MRWLPLDPPWLVIPVIAGILLAAAVLSNDGSFLLMWLAAGIAIVCGTFGLDRWYERRHPGGRLR